MKNKRIYIINVNEIAYFIMFSVLIMFVVWIMSKGMQKVDISMPLTKVYNVDQANAINSVANNATGRINNTIAISAIFFTVVVASISVFQFIKIKDFDKIKDNILANAVEIEERINESKADIITLDDKCEELDSLRKSLEFKNAQLQVELNNLKINKCLNEYGSGIRELPGLINESIQLGNEFGGVLSNSEMADLYFKLACYENKIFNINDIKVYLRIKEKMRKCIDLIKDSNENDQKIEIYKFMICIERERENNEEASRIINEMGELLQEDIEEELWLLKNIDAKCEKSGWDDFSQPIRALEELQFYYNDKSIEYIKKCDELGEFNNLKKNLEFNNKLQEIIGKMDNA